MGIKFEKHIDFVRRQLCEGVRASVRVQSWGKWCLVAFDVDGGVPDPLLAVTTKKSVQNTSFVQVGHNGWLIFELETAALRAFSEVQSFIGTVSHHV